jgi:hypothetical protein
MVCLDSITHPGHPALLRKRLHHSTLRLQHQSRFKVVDGETWRHPLGGRTRIVGEKVRLYPVSARRSEIALAGSRGEGGFVGETAFCGV